MSVNTKLSQVYGIQNPRQTVVSTLITSNRDPESSDICAIGQNWSNRLTGSYFVFTSYGNWSNQTSGAGYQASLDLTGTGTVLTLDTGDASLGGDLAVTGDTTLTGNLIVDGLSALATLSVGGVDILVGSGAPSGISAPQGSLYINSSGATTTTRLYINYSSGSGTSWTNFTAAN